MRTFAPTEEEYALLSRVCTAVRCHRDMDFEPPTRTTVRVQERYAHDVNGIALVLEHYAHGLRSLKARGWYFILPIDHHVHPHAYGAVNVYDEDQWLADLIFLKMYLSA